MAESVGSVSVDVVPDARGFWRDFKAQTAGEATRAGQQAGEQVSKGISSQGDKAGDEFSRKMRSRIDAAIRTLPKAKIDADASTAERRVSLLRAQLEGLSKSFQLGVDDADAVSKLAALHAELDQLSRTTDIRVRVNATAAQAELAKLREEIGFIDSDAKKAEKSFHPLLNSAVALGPALIPATAAVAELAVGLGALGVAGVAAIFGVRNEIAQGTAAGLQFKLGLNEAKGELLSVADVAAKATLPGFQAAVAKLHTAIPELSKDLGVLGGELGSVTAHLVGALVNGLHSFSPLLDHAAQSVDILAGKFEAWSTGPGGAKFGEAIGRSFDQAAPALAAIAEAVTHVVAAFAPVGGTILAVVGDLAKAINAIPLPILQGLATAFVALNSAKLVSGIFDKIASSSAAASVGLGSFVRTAGGIAAIGLAIYTVGKSLSGYIERNNSAAKSLDNFGAANASFFNALVKSNDAVDDGVKAAVAYQLQQDKLTDKAAKAGISQDQLTTAVTGTDAQFNALIATWEKSGKPSDNTIFAAKVLRQAFIDQQAAAKGATFEQLGLSASQEAVAKSAGLTAFQYLTAADALKKATDKAKAKLDLDKLEVATNFELMGTQAGLAKTYGVTTSQVQAYAAVLGVTQDQVTAGTVSAATYDAAVRNVASAYAVASQSGSEFLAQLATFSASAGTAADRAALIGATLKAANGDTLAYGAAVSGATSANFALTDAFAAQASAIAQAGQQVTSAQTGVTSADNQVRAAEQGLTQAQQQSLTAQKALTVARVDAKQALEDLNNQVIDGALAQRRAVLDLAAAQKAFNLKPTAENRLALAEARQRLSEQILGNRRLAAEKRAADKAGIEGSQQVKSAEQGIAQALAAVASAQDAQRQAAQGAAAAQKALTDASVAQTAALAESERAAINATTGLIDYSKKGAAPLVGQLQALQDAAVKVAGATYQHEIATKGAKTAADDAYKVYVNQTRGALIDEATQLGLTKTQAKKFADEYFGIANAPNIKKTIESEGADTLAAVLKRIGKLLANLTDQPWNVDINLKYLESITKGHGKFVANGGIMRSYASGGIETHWPQIATTQPGTVRVWAEPETQGEAYIPLANDSRRPRAQAVAAQTVALLGGQAEFNNGGITTTARAQNGWNGVRDVTVQQYISNPLPERASTSGPAGLRRAAYALGR